MLINSNPMFYRKFLQDSTEILSHYNITKEHRYSDSLLVYKATHRPSSVPHYIRREAFAKTSGNLSRLSVLTQAHAQGIIHASKLFLEEVNSYLLLFIIEPIPMGSTTSLSSILEKQEFTHWQKQRLFKNIACTLDALHALGAPHLALTPESIVIENRSLVMLRGFPIAERDKEDFWYAPPEGLTELECFSGRIPSDIWALGCIFAEMFVSLTPLFQGLDSQEKLQRMFEVLGIPKFSEVQEYMSWEIYRAIRSRVKGAPFKLELFKCLNDEERDLLESMLEFSPEKRPSCKDIANAPWGSIDIPFRQDQRQPNFYEQIISEPFEYREQTRLGTHSSRVSENPFSRPVSVPPREAPSRSFLSDFKKHCKYISSDETKSCVAPYRTDYFEARPFKVDQTVHNYVSSEDTKSLPDRTMPKYNYVSSDEFRSSITKPRHHYKTSEESEPVEPPDNSVYLTICSVKKLQVPNLEMPVSFSFALFTSLKHTPKFHYSEVNYSQEFPVNSKEFKKAYRHNPLVIHTHSGDLVVGSTEVYLGLLFANSPVKGWYSISSGGMSVGTIEVEVRSRVGFSEFRVPERQIQVETGVLKEIEDGLEKLNSELKKKSSQIEQKQKDDDEFDETLKQLRRLLFQNNEQKV